MEALKINIFKILSKIKNIEPSEGRGKKHLISRYKRKFVLIDESYNANPLSVRNAIERFNTIQKDKFKKYLILGDMLELGSKSKNTTNICLELLTSQISIKYSLKEKNNFHI